MKDFKKIRYTNESGRSMIMGHLGSHQPVQQGRLTAWEYDRLGK
jgi:hypothetical protein